MKKLLSMMVIVAILLVSLTGCQSAPNATTVSSSANVTTAAATTTAGGKKQEMAVATGAAGAAYYPIGSALADILSISDLGINARVQTTGGGVENVKLVNNGDVEIGLTVSYLAYNGFNAIAPYPQKTENIRTLFSNISQGILQIVVPADSSIKSIKDLKGKKVAVGPAGNAALTAIGDIFPSYGLKSTDITPSYVPYEEGLTMMDDKHVDAAIVYSAIPASAIQTLIAGKKSFRILSIADDIQKQLVDKFSYYESVTIPKSVYSTEEDIKTIGTTNILIVNKNLSTEQVYNIMKTLFTPANLEKIKASHPSAKLFSLEAAAKMAPVPLHPGAEKFFKEKGLIK